jgi:uncharacterized membrane protein
MKKRPAAPPATARPEWVVALLAAAGVVLSLYLTITKLTGSAAAFCEAGTGCDIVQASRWSTFLGVPTSAWGAVLYAALAVLAFMGLTPRRWIWAFVLATAATAFSAYLTWISVFVLRAACPWCLSVATIALVTLVVLLLRRPDPGGRRSPTRASRLALIGAVTAVVTIVFAAGVYVMEPTGGSDYATALARHLTSTGGVMYGVFW